MDQNTYIPEDFIADVNSYIPAHLSIEDFLSYCRQPLRKAVRVNTLKMTVEAFKSYCLENRWHIDPIPWCPEGFWLQRSQEEESKLPLGLTDIHLSGCIYIQEASSMLPPLALREELSTETCTVLDMASAPGSKTSQLAAMMGRDGVLVANEYSSSRLKVLAANMKRIGVGNCALSHFDAAIFGDYMYESFDHILLDAPCSGEGTVRKDPDALKNWSIESNQDIAAVQKQLIKSAFFALKPGGTLVYSTCTLTPLENQDVCQHLLDTFQDAVEIIPLNTLFEGADKATTKDGFLHIWPQTFDSEGFFIAKFTKKSSVEHHEQKVKKGAFPFSPYAKKEAQAFQAKIKKQFGIASLPGQLMQRDKELWLFPEGFEAIESKIKYARIGIQIGVIHNRGVRLAHEFATVLGDNATKNTYSMTREEASDYFQGKDLRLGQPTTATDEVILQLCGTSIGLGKWQKAKIKNSLPRDLIINNLLITW